MINTNGDSVGRFIQSVNNNKTLLDQYNIDYEYLVCEWSPYNEYLAECKRTKEIFQNNKFKNIAVDASISINEKLKPRTFYEYYCKNVGIREAKGNCTLIINSDIILFPVIVEKIATLIKNGLDNKFYRARFRCNVDVNNNILDDHDLYEPSLPDGHVCAGYSGDFLLIKKDILINIAQGYDEIYPSHRLGQQTQCDGEILFQLHLNGIGLELINERYGHIQHSKTTEYEGGGYNQQGYKNKKDWGFISYPRKLINNTLVIYHE